MTKRISMIAAAAGLAALVVNAGSAVAGTSENDLFRTGGVAQDARLDARVAARTERGPYALTGDPAAPQRRQVIFKDVQMGRGQTARVPFWTWVSQ